MRHTSGGSPRIKLGLAFGFPHRLLALADTVEFFNLVLGVKLTQPEKDALVAYRVKRPMPRIGGFQAFHTTRRTIQGFEAMLWLRKGFGFAGAWTVREQNQLLALCFGLPQVNKV